ncbi:hypothetical protein GCM10023222_30020 [Saccharopolyspora cebuensis]
MFAKELSKSAYVMATATSALLLCTAQAAASTSAPSVSVNPSTGLTDGQQVAVSLSGFDANEEVAVLECATVDGNGTVACNPADGVQRQPTDGSGSASVEIAVRASYEGYTLDGRQWGSVNCADAVGGCSITVLRTNGEVAAPISFG